MKIAVAGGTGIAGTYAVHAAQAAGHEVVTLSRSYGVDLLRDDGLAAALTGVEVIVDATNIPERDEAKAALFFEAVTERLQRVGAEVGVRRLVTLSIVGIDRASGFGYYGAKLRQEAATLAGPLSTTIVRATQFHEFGAQMVAQTKRGAVAFVPVMRSQPIAARTVAEVLIEFAVDPPATHFVEIAGPLQEDVVSMARRVIRHRRRRVRVVPIHLPGDTGRAFRGGSLLPRGEFRVAGPVYEQWLASDDSATPAF